MDLDVVDPLERILVAIATSRADYGDLAAGSSESETLLPDTLVGGNGQVLDEHQHPRRTAFFFGDFLPKPSIDARRSSQRRALLARPGCTCSGESPRIGKRHRCAGRRGSADWQTPLI